MTAQTGGRSLAYVPRPRRLLARQRGGSSGSSCQSLFFPGVLEHFIRFGFQIVQGCVRLALFGPGLQLMPDFDGGRPTDLQFTRQLGGRFALAYAPNDQYRLFGPKIPAFKDRPAIQIINRAYTMLC